MTDRKPGSRRRASSGPRQTPRRQTPGTGVRPSAAGSLPEPRAEDIERDFQEFERRLAESPVALTQATLTALRRYGMLVAERSGMLNLVSPGDRGRIFTRHLFESLVPGLIGRAEEAGRLVDVGSGAGLPGIPLALACPSLLAVLVEPRLRRAQFLEATVAGLGLSARVEVFHGTVERYIVSRPPVQAGLVTARAVGSLPRVWTWSLDLLVPGGWLAVFKGPSEAAEETALLAGPAPSDQEICPIPGVPRVLLLLRKPIAG